MEPVSLAVGVIALSSLFNSCLETLDTFDSWRDFGGDWRFLAARFKAEKLRLEQWGQSVGFELGGLLDDHHKALDDPRTLSTVKELLAAIQDVCRNGDIAYPLSASGVDTRPTKDGMSMKSHSLQNAPLESKRFKLKWVLRDKAKQITQVEQFGLLVEGLHNLVPSNGAKGAHPRDRELASGDDALKRRDETSVEKGAWIADFGRILGSIEREMEADARREVQKWLLGPHAATELYDYFIQKRIESTCDWILDRPSFLDWSSPDFPGGSAKLLWINGPAGFGKSVLCARVIDHLSSTLKTPVAHFFLSSDFGNHGDPFVAVRSWISQLISHPTALELVHEKWAAQHGQIATRTDVVRLLGDIVQSVPGCTFILDGLDECTWMGENRNIDDINSVSSFVEAVIKAIKGTTTRVMIVSRDEPEIRNGLAENDNGLVFFECKILPEDVRPDTALYSRNIIDRKLPKKTEAIKDNVSQKMADRCNGQFLWLKLQGNHLRQWRNQKQLEDTIDKTPIVLEDLYKRNWIKMSSLQDGERARAFSLLRWVAFALRPLTVCEITEALLISDGYDDLPVDEMPDAIDEEYIDSEILTLCGSLLEIRSSPSQSDAGLRTVHLAHFSVKQYLVSNIPAEGKPQRANGTSREAAENTILAKECLRYLSFPSVWLRTSDADVNIVFKSFRDYAAGSWSQHATVNKPTDAEVVKLVNNLFDTSNANWNSWKEWFDSNNKELGELEIEATPTGPLYYAALLGLTETVNFLVKEHKQSVHEKGNFQQTALGAACKIGYLEVVEILLNAGAETGVTDNCGSTPLNDASMTGHFEVVKLLLEKGADITITDYDGWNPLMAASSEGHFEVVKLLLEKGADITVATSNYGWDSLISASLHGHVEVAKLLLEKGANIAIADDNGWTPLNAASLHGHVEVVKLLLEKGADTTIVNNYGWTPLIVASMYGNTEAVKLLLGKGADDTIADRTYGSTPLILASENGHVEVVKLLLENSRANAEVEDKAGCAPLFYAAARGHSGVVQLLLSSKVAVNAKGRYNSTPLFAAIRNGHETVVEQLLRLEIPIIDFEDGLGRTLFWWATKSGNIRVVELVRQCAQRIGVELPDSDLDMEYHSVKSNRPARWCDVCTRSSLEGDAYYRCELCPGGDFDICLDCGQAGAKCYDASHEWAFRQSKG